MSIDDLYARNPGSAPATAAAASPSLIGGTPHATASQARTSLAAPSLAGPASRATASTARTADATAQRAGLLTAAASLTGTRDARAERATGRGYDAAVQSVPSSTLVDSEINRVSAQDSLFTQQARQQGLLTAARRGLSNSSIAAGAAEASRIASVLPVAQQNSDMMFRQGINNQDSTNRAREFGASADNNASALNAQLGTQVDLSNADAANRAFAQDAQLATQTSQFNASQGNEQDRFNANTGTQVSLANADAANRAGLQDAQVASQTSQFNADQSNAQTRFDATTGTQVSLANADAANRAGLQDSQIATQTSQFNAAQDAEAARVNAQLGTDTAQRNAELATQVNLANSQAENTARQDVLRANAELNRQFLAGTQAQDLATIQGRYEQLISTNASASRLYESFFQSISQFMANKDIPPDRVAQYVQVQQAMLQNGLSVIDALNGMDLSNFEMPRVSGDPRAIYVTPPAPRPPAGAPAPGAPTPGAPAPGAPDTWIPQIPQDWQSWV